MCFCPRVPCVAAQCTPLGPPSRTWTRVGVLTSEPRDSRLASSLLVAYSRGLPPVYFLFVVVSHRLFSLSGVASGKEKKRCTLSLNYLERAHHACG